jgi:hypothetical protein
MFGFGCEVRYFEYSSVIGRPGAAADPRRAQPGKPMPPSLFNIRRSPLAVCVGAVWGLVAAASPASATTRVVGNCADDNSAGSLRKVVQAAHSGDVVDLTSLPCSQITLTIGAVLISVNDLTLQGPSTAHAPLTLSGGGNYRVLDHSTLFGTGTLHIDHLTIASGKYNSSTNRARGGCLYSNSDVTLTNSTVTLCTARQQAGGVNGVGARGGGIYAIGTVTLLNSTVSSSTALSVQNGYSALGGGIVAKAVNASYSTITGNKSVAGTGAIAGGGGIATGGGTISASTIDTNSADYAAGIDFFGNGQVSISNCTVSANTATSGAGGIGLYFQQSLHLSNSTIAFNQSMSGTGGLSVAIGNSLVMHSTIIAENTTISGSAADLHAGSASVSGAHNLVLHKDGTLPAGFVTINGNPKLAPLGDHGGPTRTNALSTGSYAIDQGDNLQSLFDDQRGLGYSRDVGFTFAPDIGAYERQEGDDEIFADGF